MSARLKANMKTSQKLIITTLSALIAAAPFAGLAADSKKPYPLKTCVVSGEKLDSMGTPYVYTYKDREIKFCCKDCVKDFKKDPAKYVKKIEAAEKK